jgi:hypothetical protein
MAKRKHAADMAKIYNALGSLREGCDLATVTAVMERLAAAARRPSPPIAPLKKVVIVTRDTLASRRMKLMSGRFTEARGGTMKEGIVHWDGPGDPVEMLTGIPSPPEPFPRTKRGRPISADRYLALLLAVAYHGLTGEPPTRNRKLFYWFVEVVFRELFGRTAPRSALHEACNRWERSRGFSKRNMQAQLFGAHISRKGARLRRAWQRKSPPTSSASG